MGGIDECFGGEAVKNTQAWPYDDWNEFPKGDGGVSEANARLGIGCQKKEDYGKFICGDPQILPVSSFPCVY